MTGKQPCVWITGASSGIGRAAALEFARRGETVAASARGADALGALADAARGLPGKIIPFACDVTDRAMVFATVAQIEDAVGPIETAILNAGTHIPLSPQAGFDLAGFDKLVTLNLTGTANCVAAVLERQLQRPSGQLAIVSSVAGYFGLKTASAYGATKAALINMAEALRFDLKGTGIDVRLVNPGFVETPLTDKNPFPMPMIIPAEQAARDLWKGLRQSQAFEITFPKSFARMMKFIRLLPYRLFFPLVGRITNG